MSFPMVNLENFQIPLEEIISATENFSNSPKYRIARGEFSVLYRGQLSENWGNRTAAFKRFFLSRCDGKKELFLNELKIISILNHENIIPFLGYCDEGGYLIIVYEYPVNGNLADHLANFDMRSRLSWAQRLQICIDVAKGLDYLHSGLGEYGRLIHRCIVESSILLDDNLKAKICGFDLSVLIPGNDIRPQVYKRVTYEPDTVKFDPRESDYIDPVYSGTGWLGAESDIFSFGVLLFHILTTKGPSSEWRDMINAVRRCYVRGLDKLIDPVIIDQIGGRSFHIIKEIAFKCISFNIKDRPTVYTIIKTFEEALHIQNREAISVEGSHGEYRNPIEFHIPLEEIELATQMSEESSHRNCINSYVYTAELSKRWPNRTVVFRNYSNPGRFKSLHWPGRQMFCNELEIVSRFHHENIISYIGYCDEGDNMILIYEHAVNGSLRDHLQDQDKLRCIPWEKRLKICLGAARGLRCLHSGLWDENRLVVHRQVRSEYILLDENMEAKISEFDLSVFVPRNKPQVSDNTWVFEDFKASMDPIYKQSYIVNTQVDVYSFGCVMFEILSGLIMVSQRTHIDSEKPDLIEQVHHHYGDNEMDKLIDPNIRDQIDGRSLQTFAETAYRCLSYDIKERPSINRIIRKIEEALYLQKHRGTDSTIITTTSLHFEKLEELLIPLKEINLATCDFNDTSEIGKGGFGVVYKGRLSEQWKNHEVAIKRLDKTGHQGKKEFLNELKLIFKFHHPNIIPFIGYCDEGDEMILVYEYACNGSLDHHLQDKNRRRCLTWVKRLKICLGAAQGLDYLHTGLGEDNRVIHRDVKSGNILLDENMEAKICDFGLSKSDSTFRQQQQSKLYTKAAGTNYYVDPIYHESGILRTESDVYSFGVVMFEMLSGMPAWHQRSLGSQKPQPLINLVRRYYDHEKDLLIDPEIESQIDKDSFHAFIEIAYQCISFNSKERPTMEKVADKIEEALEFQVKKDVSSKGD